MIKFNKSKIENLEQAWNLIRDGKIRCEDCNEIATDLHNHKSKNPDNWVALCAKCHAEREARGCAWTPIGMIALRYADIIKAINQMKNRIRLRERLDWDGIEMDYKNALKSLKANREKLKEQLANIVQEHPFWDNYLKNVKGIGPCNSALLIAVMERAWKVGIKSIRDQRRYFGLAPNGVFESKAENQKYHSPCKWLISQALANAIMMQMGTFGKRYSYHREIVDNEHPDWSKGHQYNATWIRVAREFMKCLFIVWARNRNYKIGQKHPNDDSPEPKAWIVK